jgi:hypothetical protein
VIEGVEIETGGRDEDDGVDEGGVGLVEPNMGMGGYYGNGGGGGYGGDYGAGAGGSGMSPLRR